MKRVTLILAATALVTTLTAASCVPDDETDYGLYVGVAAVGVDVANEVGIQIALAGNISEAGMQQILLASDNVTNALGNCYGILESARAGEDTTFNVVGCVTNTLSALESLFALADVEGSPFSGQSTAAVIGSLFATTYPEMNMLRTEYEAAQEMDMPLPLEVVETFVLNAVGSNERLADAIEGQPGE